MSRWMWLIPALLWSLGGFPSRGADTEVADESAITDRDRDHWAFQPVRRPAIPVPEDRDWGRNPIDRFIRASQEREGLSPAPEADRVTLARRLVFDLTGLPPDWEMVEAFARDPAPDAYEALVERVLSSPGHGERWSQHWLDLVRYAETDGFEHDLERNHAWKYRDWVIDALNRDLPYDTFLHWQLAGDELHPEDPGAVIATGFLLCGPDMPDINLADERRHNVLNDLTGTVGASLLGLQVGCAACHDHKYDPISQADFYRLRACFEPVEMFRDHPLPVPVAKPESESPAPFGRVARESTRLAEPGRLFVRGDFRRPGPTVEAGWLRVVAPRVWVADAPPADATTTTRRTQLARWLTEPDHPLTARVIVNRLWQHHFGEGLVRTPSDFGRLGADPTHPELLDWLAAELVSSGWSLKHLHRLMLTSATWRQASRLDASPTEVVGRERVRAAWERSLEKDPANQLLSRFRRRRLDGEEIRDALLAGSGAMNRQSGGPGVRPPLPPEVVQTLLANQWKVSAQPAEFQRRSIYLFVRRNLRYPLFEAFDRPDSNASCPQRGRSTIAPQSLVMLNSELSLTSARSLAGRLLLDQGWQPSGLVSAAFRRWLGRLPSDRELAQGGEFLEQRVRAHQSTPCEELQALQPDPPIPEIGSAQGAAVVELCLSLVNVNEFLYLD